MENKRTRFAEASEEEIKKLVDKNPQNMLEQSKCIYLENLFGGL